MPRPPRKVCELERIRREAGFGVQALAHACEKTHSYLSQIEAGRIAASPAFRQEVAFVLDVPESVLFDFEGFAIGSGTTVPPTEPLTRIRRRQEMAARITLYREGVV